MKRSGSKLIAKAGSVKNINKAGFRFHFELQLESCDQMLGSSDVVCSWERGPKVVSTPPMKIDKTKRVVNFNGVSLKQDVTMFKKKKTDAAFEPKVYRLAIRTGSESGKIVGKIDLNFAEYIEIPSFTKRIAAPLSSGGRLILRVNSNYLGEVEKGRKGKKKGGDDDAMSSVSGSDFENEDTDDGGEAEERAKVEQDLDDLAIDDPSMSRPTGPYGNGGSSSTGSSTANNPTTLSATERYRSDYNTPNRFANDPGSSGHADYGSASSYDGSSSAGPRSESAYGRSKAPSNSQGSGSQSGPNNYQYGNTKHPDADGYSEQVHSRRFAHQDSPARGPSPVNSASNGNAARYDERYQAYGTGSTSNSYASNTVANRANPVDGSRRQAVREEPNSVVRKLSSGAASGSRPTADISYGSERRNPVYDPYTSNRGQSNGPRGQDVFAPTSTAAPGNVGRTHEDDSMSPRQSMERLRAENKSLRRENDQLREQLAASGMGGFSGSSESVEALMKENRDLRRDVEELEGRLAREPVYADVVRELRESKMALAILTLERDELQQNLRNAAPASGIASRNLL